MSEQAEKLARRMAREVPAEPPYYSGESEFAQHEDDMTAALLPFAEVMVRLAEAAQDSEEDHTERTQADYPTCWCGNSWPCSQKALLASALAAFDALVKEGE